MNAEEALKFVELLVIEKTGTNLDDVGKALIVGVWQGYTYDQIAASNPRLFRRSLRDDGSKLWQLFSEVLAEKVTKTTFKSILEAKYLTSQQNQEDWPPLQKLSTSTLFSQYWQEPPYLRVFYGRDGELDNLKKWIVEEKCQLVAVSGMTGMGKTALAAKLAADIGDEFNRVLYCSLQDSPTLRELLADLVFNLSNGTESDNSDKEIPVNTLIYKSIYHYLRSQPCLLLLDEVQTILQDGKLIGKYKEGYEDYGRFFRRLTDISHQSYLVLISWENPPEINELEGEEFSVRSLKLTGLDNAAAGEIFQARGFSGREEKLGELIELYKGNPLQLKLVAGIIKDVYAGNVAAFLQDATLDFDGIRQLLDSHFRRLSDLEKEIMYYLASGKKEVSLEEMRDKFKGAGLTSAVASLRRRSLLEQIPNQLLYSLQPIMMKYVKRLVEN